MFQEAYAVIFLTFRTEIGLSCIIVESRLVVIMSLVGFGALAEQLRSGLQNRVDGCNSRRCLHFMKILLAGCVVVDEQNRWLLLHRENTTYNHWEIPGGKVEPGEEPYEAAKRELLEELGIAVLIKREIGRAEFTDRDKQFEYVWFLAGTNDLPRIMEAQTFTEYKYLDLSSIREGNIVLSEGAKKLLTLVASGEVTL